MLKLIQTRTKALPKMWANIATVTTPEPGHKGLTVTTKNQPGYLGAHRDAAHKAGYARKLTETRTANNTVTTTWGPRA